MTIEYYYLNDLNKLYNSAIQSVDGDDKIQEMMSALDNLEAYIQSMEHWKDTALQLSKNNGEACADAERLATEYEATLKEIGGVWWEDPYEKSPALIAHKNRKERLS
jgi:hypothetical protein